MFSCVPAGTDLPTLRTIEPVQSQNLPSALMTHVTEPFTNV
jgi:hypothetical protein